MRADRSSPAPLEVMRVGHAKPLVMSGQILVPGVISMRLGGLGRGCVCVGRGLSVNVKGTCVPRQGRHTLSLPLLCHLASSNAARTRAVCRRASYNRKQLTE